MSVIKLEKQFVTLRLSRLRALNYFTNILDDELPLLMTDSQINDNSSYIRVMNSINIDKLLLEIQPVLLLQRHSPKRGLHRAKKTAFFNSFKLKQSTTSKNVSFIYLKLSLTTGIR